MTTSKDRDKRKVRWINNQSNESMTPDALSDLAEQGFTACNERCPTHRDSPGYPCDCLLDTFQLKNTTSFTRRLVTFTYKN